MQGACGNPTGDISIDPVVVDPSRRFIDFDDFSDLEADYVLPTNSCLGAADTTGEEKVYAVDLAIGETVTATYTNAPDSSPNDDLALYILLNECNDTSACVGGASATNSGVQTITGSYTNTTGAPATVFVVADSEATSSDAFQVTIDVQ